MTSISLHVRVPSSPAVVWDEMRHIERHVEWMHDAVAITFTSDQREGVGTSFVCATKIGPLRTNDVMVITRWDDAAVMGVEHRGLITGRGEFTLSPDGDGTRITWTEDLVFPWWLGGALGAVVARPILRAVWRRNLALLARRLG